MSEHGEKQPADVLRTKRLEIVDDEGKVRAVLGSSARTSCVGFTHEVLDLAESLLYGFRSGE